MDQFGGRIEVLADPPALYESVVTSACDLT
jgi:hypothetical protein